MRNYNVIKEYIETGYAWKQEKITMETEDAQTLINHCGSKWAGMNPDGVEKLLEVLKEYPLDKTFEKYGDFYNVVHPEDYNNPETDYVKRWAGAMHFWGNFRTLSHGFDIMTKDQDLIVELINAIEANKQRPDYISQ